MNRLTNVGIVVLVQALLAGCSGQPPLQPPPPTYTQWLRNGESTDSVKSDMRACGYIDLYGYGEKGRTEESVAKRETCMFNKGYVHSSWYKGICSLAGKEKIQSCKQ